MNSPSETLRAEIIEILAFLLGVKPKDVRPESATTQSADEILSALLNKLPEKKHGGSIPRMIPANYEVWDNTDTAKGWNTCLDTVRQILEGK